jgi:plasmid stabilization system protein ParE
MIVRLTDSAAHDVYEILQYYAALDRRLGSRFIDELDRVRTLLADNACMGYRLAHGRRRLLLKTFPYAIVYAVTEPARLIRIVAVVHESRRPGSWQNQVQELAPLYAAIARINPTHTCQPRENLYFPN